MSRKTFDWERAMQPFMDRIYRQWGWEVDRSVSCKQYDVRLIRGEKVVTVEEKYLFTEKKYDQLIVEIVQDIVSGDLGWFYHARPDYLIWIYCAEDRKSGPINFWVIRFQELHTILVNQLKKCGTSSGRSVTSYIVPENYGVTLNLPVKFADLGKAATHHSYREVLS